MTNADQWAQDPRLPESMVSSRVGLFRERESSGTVSEPQTSRRRLSPPPPVMAQRFWSTCFSSVLSAPRGEEEAVMIAAASENRRPAANVSNTSRRQFQDLETSARLWKHRDDDSSSRQRRVSNSPSFLWTRHPRAGVAVPWIDASVACYEPRRWRPLA